MIIAIEYNIEAPFWVPIQPFVLVYQKARMQFTSCFSVLSAYGNISISAIFLIEGTLEELVIGDIQFIRTLMCVFLVFLAKTDWITWTALKRFLWRLQSITAPE